MSDIPTRHARRLFALSRDLLIVVDRDARILNLNPSWERVLGYRVDELIGRAVYELQHPDDVERTERGVRSVQGGAEATPCENRYRHADGRYVWLRWTSVLDECTGLIYGAARDVTSERQAQEDLRASLQRMEDTQRAARVRSWEMDLRTGEMLHAREMYEIHGLEPAADLPWDLDDLLDRIVPEHRHRFHEGLARAHLRPGVTEMEYRMHAPADRLLRTIVEVVRDADGAPTIVKGTTQDVTELRENERRLAEAERVGGLGSFEFRRSDGRLLWSPGAYRLFGIDPEGPPITPETFYEQILPEEAKRVREMVAAAERAQRPYEFEFSLARDGGERIILLGRGETDLAGGEMYVRGTLQDVTKERRIARQQREIARLGQMALAGTELEPLCHEVCRVVTEVLTVDMCDVLAVQGDGSLAFAATRGFPEPLHGTAIAADQDSVVHQALSTDSHQVVRDWLTEERFPYPRELRELGLRSVAVLPIRGRQGPFGVLATHSRTPGAVDSEGDVAFLDALASFLATVIERLAHEAEIAALATLRGRLVADNLEAEERVRRRISEQLHDGALQDLLAARQDLVEAATPGDGAARDEVLGYARQGVERAVRLLREAVHALHPVVLQHGGLEAAMQAAAHQAARQGSFRAAVSVDPAATGVRDELVMSIARELLNNCAKHAHACVVHVTVGRENGTVLLEVADDGRGLDPGALAAAPLNGHIGLASLIQRVEAVGGTLDLQRSTGGRGTTVLARLPIG